MLLNLNTFQPHFIYLHIVSVSPLELNFFLFFFFPYGLNDPLQGQGLSPLSFHSGKIKMPHRLYMVLERFIRR